nr:hypothetical protein CFP56_78004 [Quercus suber]
MERDSRHQSFEALVYMSRSRVLAYTSVCNMLAAWPEPSPPQQPHRRHPDRVHWGQSRLSNVWIAVPLAVDGGKSTARGSFDLVSQRGHARVHGVIGCPGIISVWTVPSHKQGSGDMAKPDIPSRLLPTYLLSLDGPDVTCTTIGCDRELGLAYSIQTPGSFMPHVRGCTMGILGCDRGWVGQRIRVASPSRSIPGFLMLLIWRLSVKLTMTLSMLITTASLLYVRPLSRWGS